MGSSPTAPTIPHTHDAIPKGLIDLVRLTGPATYEIRLLYQDDGIVARGIFTVSASDMASPSP